MAAEDDIDIDDIASSLLLDDDRLASIFQLALDDDEEDGGVQGGTAEPFQQQQATKFTASERAAPAPPAPHSIQSLPTPSTTVAEERPDAARMQESSLPMEQRQPMNVGPAPGQQQPYRWIPPFPGWRWGMPLPPGYPPPPMPPQWMHQQMQMQMRQQQQQQQQQPEDRGQGQGQEGVKSADGARAAGWGSGAGAAQANSSDAAVPSLAEIQAQQASGNDKEPFPGSEVSALVVAAKEKRKQAEKKQRSVKKRESSEFPRGCFWHLQGPLPRVRPSAMMSVGDLVYILKEFMRPLRADDPLRDDYYFVEAENKQLARKMAGLAPTPLGENEGLSADMPSFPGMEQKSGGGKDAKANPLSALQREVISVTRLQEKAREWQTSSQSLGRHQKASIRQPRRLISVPVVDEAEGMKSDAEAKSNANDVGSGLLSSSGWAFRAAIDKGLQLIIEIKKVDGMITREINIAMMKGEQPNPEIQKERQEQRRLLCEGLASVCGITGDAVDSSLLNGICTLTKGRKMLHRAIPLLSVPQLGSFVVAAAGVLKQLVAVGDPSTVHEGKNLAEQKARWWAALVDQKIGDALVEAVGRAVHGPHPSAGPAPRLNILVEFLKALLESNTSASLQSLLQTRSGATVVQSVVAQGQQLCPPRQPEMVAVEWDMFYSKFVKMASPPSGQ